METVLTDHGQEIKEKYFGQIFRIFQRLARREDREGPSAELSVTKKMIQRSER
jgi:light-regulated signal transduction histidine kinase (bacteriophytochrome)